MSAHCRPEPRPEPAAGVAPVKPQAPKVMSAGIVVLMIVTLAAMVWLWPSADQRPDPAPAGNPLSTATIVKIDGDTMTVRIDKGPDAGTTAMVPGAGELVEELAIGDTVLVDGFGAGNDRSFYLVDLPRLTPLLALLGLFALAVISVSRWHGVRALAGLAGSLAVVLGFIVPAVLAGRPPATTALVGAVAIMITTLYLTHGRNAMTHSAIAGTTLALAATVGLAVVFLDAARITGLSSHDASAIQATLGGIDLRGLLLAGLIISALGVLDDVTVSQSSTVFALHATDPSLSFTELFARAMTVGRDHIASVVNTLVLAYTGASISLVLLFNLGGLPVTELLNAEVVATEIIRTLVGSLGLVAAVPATTAMAAYAAVGRDPSTAPAAEAADEVETDVADSV